MDSKKILTAASVAVAVFIVGGLFFFFVVAPGIVRAPSENDTLSPALDDLRAANPGYTITEIPINDIRTLMPDPSRPIVFAESIPDEVRAGMTENARRIATILNDDPTRTDLWFNLAILYHSANDYEGARAIWEFLTEVAPDDTTAFDNLGKLYHFSLRDYPKAESYFKQSLALQPNVTAPYLNLFDLYRYSYKTDTDEAVSIMNKAFEKFPQDIDLRILLADYYRDRGEFAKAKEAYLVAMDFARAASDVVRMNAIGDSLSTLPQ